MPEKNANDNLPSGAKRKEVGPPGEDPATARSWVSVATAAAYLGLSPDRLRKTLERHAQRVEGGMRSTVDGVTARKFGRLWRVRFSACWTAPDGV